MRAVVFGRERRLRLTGARGHHVIGQTADEGPTGLHLITAANVLPESYEAYRQFVESLTDH